MFDIFDYKSEVLDFSELQNAKEQWELLETIGEGTYGEVYCGRNRVTDEVVAIKVMESVTEVLEEIEEEYLVLRDLSDHPNMPRFHGIYLNKDGGVGEEEVWFVMELCSAGSVTDLARHLIKSSKRMEEMVIAHIVKETLKVLVHMHSHEVIHRDVKGHNILITSKGDIKIVDFGVSGHLDSPNGRKKTHVGTPYWMAPEVIACEQQLDYTYDVRCDVWSLGITAIEMADGKPPLGDLDPRRALFKIPRNPPPSPRQPELWSPLFKDFVHRCLIKDFEQRPLAEELLEHPFVQQVPGDCQQFKNKLVSLTSAMEKKVSEPDITTKHGQFKSNRKSKRDGGPTAENLALLELLDEETIVTQLSHRYSEDEIYTYIGDILLAVNPFVALPIYTDEYIKCYQHAVKADNPPHIFAVADQSYQMMMHNKRHQCIVISGESGAGKTESANLLVQQLTQLGKASNRALEERILQVNPLMEAFGNAKTIINDNSSRFGKYLEMFFTANSGAVVGAKITEYLLEKSRVIHQAPGEQNFHIFYYVHDGLISDDKERQYHLKPNSLYRYIAQYTNGSTNVSSLSMNRVKFKAIEHCFEIIGFKPEEVTAVYSILAAILHIGNIDFKAKESDEDACTISNTELVTIVCKLLGLDFTDLLECLTTTGMVAKGEVIIRNNSQQEASNARDAMSKSLYGRLFSWIVNRISSLLKPSRVERDEKESHIIGLLDIFGFENFKSNSFEQLCINIANEQIQYYFNQHIFAWELEEYKNEGIDASLITYVDNRPILDMFLMKPVGVLALLDEESHFPKATDGTLVEKFHQNVRNSHYIRPKSTNLTFIIDHFAGKVEYDAQGFLEKNRDRLPVEIMNIMKLSENKVVNALFQTPLTRTGNLCSGSSSNRSSRGGSPMSTSHGVTVVSYNSKNSSTMGGSRHATNSASMTRIQQTVSTYFRFSLMDLLNKMVAGTPHFVRCIKPNDQKEPGNFNSQRVTTQLRYTGVLETTRIRKQGYSHRIAFSEFLKRYHVLGFSHDEAVSVTGESCGRLLNNLGMTQWAVGKTKIFLKYYHVEELAHRYEAVCQKIIRVQSYIRMWLVRTRFHQMRWNRDKASITIQRHIRGFVCRRKYLTVRSRRDEAATSIQKVVKGRQARTKYRPIIEERREAAVRIQSNYRMYQCKKSYKQRLQTIKEEEMLMVQKNAENVSAKKIQRLFRNHRMKDKTHKMVVKRQNSATTIQSYFRMWHHRSHYRALKAKKAALEQRMKEQRARKERQAEEKRQAETKKQAEIEKQAETYKQAEKEKEKEQADKKEPGTPSNAHVKRSNTASSPADSPKKSVTDSPSKKAWERMSQGAVGEARVDQMKKMQQVKKIMPDREANYYDEVSSEAILPTDVANQTLMSLTNRADLSNNNNNSNVNDNDNNTTISSIASRIADDGQKNNKNNSNNNNNNNGSSSQPQSYSSNDNSKRLATMPEVVVNGANKDDFDIDEEVMGFMHSYIQSHMRAKKDKKKKPSKWEIARRRLMDNETKAYFDEVIRGSGLFGIMADDNADSDGDAIMKSPTQEAAPPKVTGSSPGKTDEVDNKTSTKGESSGSGQQGTSWSQFTRVLLAKKVAEVFVANKPDASPADEASDSSSYRPMNDNMPSWDAPLMSARDNALAPDDYNEALNGRISRHSECSIEADLHTERENMLEEEDAAEMAKRLESELAGTILALWQERLTQKSSLEDELDIEYASESDPGSTGPPTPTGLGPSSHAIPPPAQFADNAKINARLNQTRTSVHSSIPVNPMAPVKLPLLGEGNNNALEEIRARLRKTKFDYSTDSRQRISDATPQLDYRAVLKKKGHA